jgi:hypothetical protein
MPMVTRSMKDLPREAEPAALAAGIVAQLTAVRV